MWARTRAPMVVRTAVKAARSNRKPGFHMPATAVRMVAVKASTNSVVRNREATCRTGSPSAYRIRRSRCARVWRCIPREPASRPALRPACRPRPGRRSGHRHWLRLRFAPSPASPRVPCVIVRRGARREFERLALERLGGCTRPYPAAHLCRTDEARGEKVATASAIALAMAIGSRRAAGKPTCDRRE